MTDPTEPGATEPGATGPDATEAGARASQPGRRLGTIVVGLVLAALAVVAALLLVGGGGGGGAELRYEVPAGTGARLDAGEQVEIIPRQLELDAGDTVVIVNEDDRVHVVGPFSVRAGETTSYTFDEPGRYLGACSIHPDGEITILVR